MRLFNLFNSFPPALALFGTIGLLTLVQLMVPIEWLRFQRAEIGDGQWWRLLSSNFIHLGWSHFAMNMLGLALVGLLFGRYFSLLCCLGLVFFCALVVNLGLLVFNPWLHWYIGFSGVLHGLLLAGALLDAFNQRGVQRLLSWLLFWAVVAKLVWEQWYGALPGSAEFAGGTVIVDAHLYGGVGGVVFIGLWTINSFGKASS